jgi:small-conductance mechanosensitive channel
MNFEAIRAWTTPLSFLLGGLLIGFILDKVLLKRLRRISSTTDWRWDNILAEGFAGFPLLWCFLGGLYGASLTAPISAAQLKLAEKILLVVLILSVTIALARIAAGMAAAYSSKSEGQLRTATILTNFTRIFVYALGLLTIFYSFGINITPALTALGIGGLAVALALQDTLSNFFSGLQIIASKQVSPGDFIKLTSGEQGYVTDITWRNTCIRTLPNNLVIIPNSKLASDIFTNFYLPDREMAVLAQVGVSYKSDLAKVEAVTIEVAQEVMGSVAGAVPEFQPFIRYHTFDEFSINFSVIMRGREFTDQYLIKHEFIKRLHERYRKENIEIPFPIRTVYLNQEKSYEQ